MTTLLFKNNNFINMINKFHKTTYPRGHNFNVVSSSQGKRNNLYQQPTDCINPHKAEMPIERKI